MPIDPFSATVNPAHGVVFFFLPRLLIGQQSPSNVAFKGLAAIIPQTLGA